MATILETTTKVRRGYYGIEAETIKTVNGQTWEIFTMKRYSGSLVTTAQACKVSEGTTGSQITQYTQSQDERITLLSEKVRVTEAAVRRQHEKALQIFAEKVQ